MTLTKGVSILAILLQLTLPCDDGWYLIPSSLSASVCKYQSPLVLHSNHYNGQGQSLSAGLVFHEGLGGEIDKLHKTGFPE